MYVNKFNEKMTKRILTSSGDRHHSSILAKLCVLKIGVLSEFSYLWIPFPKSPIPSMRAKFLTKYFLFICSLYMRNAGCDRS